MSSETGEAEQGEMPYPVPATIVFGWMALLEGLIAAALVVFAIPMLEAGGILPDILAEWSVGLGTFVVVTALSFYVKWR